MSGLHVGRLNVYLKDHHGNERLLWRLFGHQNNTWSEALVPVDVLISQYQVNNNNINFILTMTITKAAVSLAILGGLLECELPFKVKDSFNDVLTATHWTRI